MLTGAEALAMAQTAWVYTAAGIAGMILFVVGGFALINRRWGWYPRKVQRTRFGERF